MPCFVALSLLCAYSFPPVPEHKLQWTSALTSSSHTLLDGVTLDKASNSLVVNRTGRYYIFGRVRFNDPHAAYYSLLLDVTNEGKTKTVASSGISNPLIWEPSDNGTDSRVVRARKFLEGQPETNIFSKVKIDQKNAFDKSVNVNTIVMLDAGDSIRLVPRCKLDNTPAVCNPFLKIGRRHHNLGLFML